MSLTICPSLGHNHRPTLHPSLAFCRPWVQLWWITLLPFQPPGPWRSSAPPWPCSHSPSPSHPTLSPSLCPSSSCSPLGSAGLASTQSPSISSTSDIIGTEKSWEHSFPMILKWHQGHSGPAVLLAGRPTGCLNDWVTGWPWKQRTEAHNLAGLASGFPTFHAPKHLAVITAQGCCRIPHRMEF